MSILYICRKISFPAGARLLLCSGLSHWLEASDDGLSSLAGGEELLHWFKASQRLSSLVAWLEASHGFFSLVVGAVPVTESELLVVLTAIKAFAALLLTAVSIGSCFKILGNLSKKKNRISFQPKKKRVNAAKQNNARLTCGLHMSMFYLLRYRYLLRQYWYGIMVRNRNNITP
jgi:hypothetical protein